MTNRYACPDCHAEIPLSDINVAQDVALCRSCGKATPFSIVSGISEIDLSVLSTTSPKTVQTSRDLSSGATKIVYHRLSPLLLFFIPFTTFWSGISMWGIYGRQFINGKFELKTALFGLPFLFGTIILLCVIAFMIFGKWIITLERGNGTVFTGIGSLGWTRRFTYNRDSIVSLKMTNVENNGIRQKGIAITTNDKEIVFGTMFKENVKKYIAAELTKNIKL